MPRLTVLVPVLASTVLAGADPVVRIPYTVSQESRVSLGVYDAQGKLVRTLLTGAPRHPGSYVAVWDGRDRYGTALPAGTYGWKQASSTGLTAEFIVKLGINPGTPYEVGVGNHAPPDAAAVDAGGVTIIAKNAEGASRLRKTDWEGRTLWSSDRWTPNAENGFGTVAGDNGRIYDLNGAGRLWIYESASGRVLTNGYHDPAPIPVRWPGDAESDGYAATVGMDLAFDRAADLVVASYR